MNFVYIPRYSFVKSHNGVTILYNYQEEKARFQILAVIH